MYYHDIKHCDMLNGEGIRVSLWVSGCCIHCKGCHNPQTWSFCGGTPFNIVAKNEIFHWLEQPYISGITLTGGNPLDSAVEILELCREIKQKFPDKDIWLYSGYTFEEIREKEIWMEILGYIDVLVDGRYIEEKRDISLHWVGSSNQRVIDVKETLKQNKVILHEEQI